MSTKASILFFAAFFPNLAIAQDHASTEPLQFKGNPLNACSSSELRRLEAEVRHIATTQNPDEAWLVSKTMLCGWTAKDRRLIRDHTPARYLMKWVVIPDAGRAMKSRDTIRPMAGFAYGVRVEATESDIGFSFTSDAISEGGFKLRYVHQQWLIVEVDEAVD